MNDGRSRPSRACALARGAAVSEHDGKTSRASGTQALRFIRARVVQAAIAVDSVDVREVSRGRYSRVPETAISRQQLSRREGIEQLDDVRQHVGHEVTPQL